DNRKATADLFPGVRASERDSLDSADAGTEALKEHGEVFKENGDLIDRHSKSAREAQAELDGIADSTHRWADAAKEAGASGEELDAIMREGRDAFVELAQDMGMSEEAANRLADELNRLPEFVKTEVLFEVTDPQGAIHEALEAGVGAVTVPVDADTDPAEEEVRIWGSEVGDVPAKVYVQADLYGVEATMEAFYAEMQDQDWTVNINGETATAEEALGILLEEVNNGEGSVTINGMTFPADTSLMALIEAINMSEGEVTITGDNSPAKSETDEAKRHADSTEGTIDVDADTSDAESSANHAARDRNSTIDVDAETWGANAAINAAARSRTAYINVVATGATNLIRSGLAQLGRAGGGWLHEGLDAGGWVPGPCPGQAIDNVLRPIQAGAAGGRSLALQPLAGTEYVVNGQSARQCGPALEAINAGVSRSELAAMIGGGGGATPVDSAAIGAAVARAVAGYQPMVVIDGRQFLGTMRQVEQQYGTRH